MSELMVQNLPIDAILPYEKNAKKHPSGQVEQIAKSIKDFGFNMPILVDEKMVIIAGHGRHLAAKKLGISEVPVVVIDSLSESQIMKFRLADNKVGESKWDESLLIEELKSLQSIGSEVLDIPGFSESEIDKLLRGLQDVKGNQDPEHVPEANSDHGIQAGDLFALGDHRLLCGDSTSTADVMFLLDDTECDMCFTDPPYNVNYQGGKKQKRKKIANDDMSEDQFFDFMWVVYKNISAALKPGGAFYICHSDSMWKAFRTPLQEHKLILKQCLVWIKNRFVLSRNHYHCRHEPILYGYKEGQRFWNGGRHNDSLVYRQNPSIVVEENKDGKTLFINTNDTSIVIEVPDYKLVYQDDGAETAWYFSNPIKSKEHPTMKPVELVKRAIRNSSPPGGGARVFDPFLGSGTTLIAAESLGRVCYGLEYSPDYCDVILRRWEAYTGNSAEQIASKDGGPHDS